MKQVFIKIVVFLYLFSPSYSFSQEQRSFSSLEFKQDQPNYNLPRQNTGPWDALGSIKIGGTRIYEASSKFGQLGQGGQLSLRGYPDGPYELGALESVVFTKNSLFDSMTALSGNLNNPANLSNDPSFDTVLHYNEIHNAEPKIILENVIYTPTQICLPNGEKLNKEQLLLLHGNMYVTTNSIDTSVLQDAPKRNQSISNPNYYVTLTQYKKNLVGSHIIGTNSPVISTDNRCIEIQGWAVLGKKGSYSPNNIPPNSLDKNKNNTPNNIAYIGSPTQTGDRNVYLTYDSEQYPNSKINYYNVDELDLNYNSPSDGKATIRGIVINMDCQKYKNPNTGCHAPTKDSIGLLINGTNLPNGIQNTIPGWGNEYMGWNMYWPASQAPGVGNAYDSHPSAGEGNSHLSWESWTPALNGNDNIITRAWVEQSDKSPNPRWFDYRINIGTVINGERWEPSGKTGKKLGRISFNYSPDNIGGVCLIGTYILDDKDKNPGLCIKSNGDVFSRGSLNMKKPIYLDIDSGIHIIENNKPLSTLFVNNKGDWIFKSENKGNVSIKGVNTFYGESAKSPFGNSRMSVSA